MTVGGCRPCAQIEDRWQTALREELRDVGAAGRVDSGVTDHLRLVLSQDAFRYATAPLAEVEVFRAVARQIAVPGPTGGRVVLDGELLLRLGDVTLAAPDADGRAVVLELQSVVSMELDTGRDRATYTTTTGTVLLRAPLRFTADGRTAVLQIDLQDAVVASLGFDSAELPSGFDGFGEPAAALVSALVAEALDGAAPTLTALRIPALALGWSELPVAPSALTIAPDGSTVSLGVVTTLRPTGRLPTAAPPTDIAGFVYQVHPDLWRAALVHLHAVGRMPRRFDEGGEPTLEGAHAVAISRAAWTDDQAALSVRAYCLVGDCRVRSHRSAGPIALASESVEVGLPPGADEVAAYVPPVFAAARETARALLNPAPLPLEASRTLSLPIDAVRVDGVNGATLSGSVQLDDVAF